MRFSVKRALDKLCGDWEKVGATEATGVGADAYAVEQLAVLTGIYRARPAGTLDETPTVFSVGPGGCANRRAIV